MDKLLAAAASVFTGMEKAADGTLKNVSSPFHWLVRLPLIIGFVLVLVALFGSTIAADRKDLLFQVGIALMIGGPVVYQGRKYVLPAPVPAAPAQPAPVPAEPTAVLPPEEPKSDTDAAKAIEKL